VHEGLARVLHDLAAPAIAVSGGVDSMTLAAAAHEITRDVLVIHATSPAVPAEATARVGDTARERNWTLQVIDAGEFEDPRYRANPVDRCFYCKSHLYGAIHARTGRPILSGANLDDLAEYRPGLDAARAYGVRHPYVEAQIAKSGVRALARELGLPEIAELPASPCLSSRVETGIRIDAGTLGFIHRVERALAANTGASTIRCRVRAAAIVIELDPETFLALSPEASAHIAGLVRGRSDCPQLPVKLEPYRNGSAFLREGAS
jgi:uncharacterized protein